MFNSSRTSTFFLLPSFLTLLCGCGPTRDKPKPLEETNPLNEADKIEVMSDIDSPLPAAWSTQGWVATDALGRSLTDPKQLKPWSKDKKVGMFYYLWHGQHAAPDVYDITKILARNPKQPTFGPRHAFHWWGQPEAGYYQADDPWVLRRNLQMLAVAGIDFLFLDVTNGRIYPNVLRSFCNVAQSMKKEGTPVPSFAFTTHARDTKTIQDLYKEVYLPGQCKDLWFLWKGKPLLLAREDNPDLSEEIKNFFTFRFSWAWTDSKNKPRHWQWLDSYPQTYGWDKDPGKAEQISVALASHPTTNLGQSFHQGKQPSINEQGLTHETGQGLYFKEQWQRALEVDPEIIMVTQWNEWIAQRFVSGQDASQSFLGRAPQTGDSYFVDAYNQEFNRDIEPMLGGQSDNHYYLLVDRIRQFKGIEPEVLHQSAQQKVDGKFDEWLKVRPVYFDPSGDTAHREWQRYDKKEVYINKTGRNDVIESRVDASSLQAYFYVRTREDLTPSTDNNWMLLYIDRDQDARTGWEGYDLLIKPGQKKIFEWQKGGWIEIGDIEIGLGRQAMEFSMERSILNAKDGTLHFDFHWADGLSRQDDINGFFLEGDSAPDRRFKYRFSL